MVPRRQKNIRYLCILSADYCKECLWSFGSSIAAAKHFRRSIRYGSRYASALQFMLLLRRSRIIIESFM